MKKCLFFLLVTLMLMSVTLIACDYEIPDDLEASQGLKLESNFWKSEYVVAGRGSCQDTQIVIPKTHSNGKPIVAIKDKAFYGDKKIITLAVPGNIKKIGTNAFRGCTNLIEVYLEKGVEVIEDRVFEECIYLQVIYMKAGIKHIGSLLIGSGAASFTGIQYNGTMAQFKAIDKNKNWCYAPGVTMVVHCNDGDLYYDTHTSDARNPIKEEPKNNTHTCTESDWIIDKEATTSATGKKHTECTSCGKVIREETIPRLEESNNGSQGLEFTLMEDGESYSVTGIGSCTDTDLIIPNTYQGLPVTKIGEFALSGCTFLRSVTINEGVTRIERWALSNCTSLTTVNISGSVTSTGYATFFGCTSLININVNESNEYYKSIDGNLYSKDGKTLVQYAIGKTSTSFEISNIVTSIGACAFECCTSLTSVIIPNSVTSIKQFAFAACTSLESIIIPDSVTSIGGWVFDDCTGLTTVIIGDGVTSIGNFAFSNCKLLTIYCEADSQPSGWDSSWNNSNRPVVWGYKPE